MVEKNFKLYIHLKKNYFFFKIKLHEYYAIIGRPRFGRSNGQPHLENDFEGSLDEASSLLETEKFVTNVTKSIFEKFDQNNDGFISKQEFKDFFFSLI